MKIRAIACLGPIRKEVDICLPKQKFTKDKLIGN